MHRLSEPDPVLAARILADVSFDQRLVGYRCRARSGQIRANLYNFKEVALLLRDKQPMIGLRDLQQWLAIVMADLELAERVAEIVASAGTDRERLLQISSLLDERLAQCRHVPSLRSTGERNAGIPV
jgi:hypothetical protein